MNSISIRKAEAADFETIHLLLKEFALFQKKPDKLTITLAQMKQDKDLFCCLLAETTKGGVAGFITYFSAYFSWSGKALYVDDLYVKEEYRNLGIGRQLLHHVIKEAKESGCRKVRWQVSDWNKNAIDFYNKMGASVDNTERNCDLIL